MKRGAHYLQGRWCYYVWWEKRVKFICMLATRLLKRLVSYVSWNQFPDSTSACILYNGSIPSAQEGEDAFLVTCAEQCWLVWFWLDIRFIWMNSVTFAIFHPFIPMFPGGRVIAIYASTFTWVLVDASTGALFIEIKGFSYPINFKC